MTVQKCSDELEMNGETLNKRQNSAYPSQTGQLREITQHWKRNNPSHEDIRKKKVSNNLQELTKDSNQLIMEQQEALNMTTNYRRNKAETAISAFREISAMEFMKNAVQQLHEKVETSSFSFGKKQDKINAESKKLKGKSCKFLLIAFKLKFFIALTALR